MTSASHPPLAAGAVAAPQRGHIDIVTSGRLTGWALWGSEPLIVEAVLDETVLASARANVNRPDVGLGYPNEGNSAACGFELRLPRLVDGDRLFADLVIRARSERVDKTFEIARQTLPMPGAGIKAASVAENARPVGPFPRQITNIIEALWPDAVTALDTPVGQAVFITRLLTLAGTPRLQSLAPVACYVRYLKAAWSHFSFVAKYFPADNTLANADAKDANCRANSPNEIMSIAHQLYVLQSYGVGGNFAEFGCFKGFSSSMLSRACEMLGIEMHIFDSFEGLPPSDSNYYSAGDFAGSLDEVRANIELFGAPRSVTFHKGFFSESLKDMVPPDLMCLWMDVDLEVSAQDLLVSLEKLSPKGNLFSHECSADIFQNGQIVVERSANNPIPPVLDKFEALGRPLTGIFTTGNTGAFWAREGGTPVVTNELLIDLVSAL